MIKICLEEPCIIKIGILHFFFSEIAKLRELVPSLAASIMVKFEQFLWEPIENIFKRSFIVLRVVKKVNKYAIDSIAY